MAGSLVADWLTWALSPTISAVLLTLLVSLLSPLLIHWYLYRSAGGKNAHERPMFLLLGPSGGGKTSLLTLFSTGKVASTHTSQALQSALCYLPAGATAASSPADQFRSEHDPAAEADAAASRPLFRLLDTPGHGKLRGEALAQVTGSSAYKGVVFVVDSAAVSAASGLAAAAEFLHDVLLALQRRSASSGSRSKSSAAIDDVPVCVLANKQDVFSSLPAALVRSRLEEEIGKVRLSRSKGLMDSAEAESEEETGWLGEYGAKEFRFKQMEEHGVVVTVLGGSVKGEDGEEKAGVDECWAWIGGQL